MLRDSQGVDPPPLMCLPLGYALKGYFIKIKIRLADRPYAFRIAEAGGFKPTTNKHRL